VKMGEWFRRLTEGSALGGRVQVPGKGVWRTGPSSGGGDLDGSPGPYKRPEDPPQVLSALQTSRLRPFFPPTDGPLLSAPSPCSSAYGRGWEEFRLGPGGSELAAVTSPAGRSGHHLSPLGPG
jgi:hypothetical protein